MKITVTSGRPNSHNNNNNNLKADGVTEDADSSMARGNYSHNAHKDDSDSTSSCSSCQSDSDSSDTTSQHRTRHRNHDQSIKKQRTKKRTKSKTGEEIGAGGGQSSSSSGSGSDSSDDDDDSEDDSSDSGASENGSQQSAVPAKKAVAKAKSPPPPHGNHLSDDDGASFSDMELPDLVTAAIQRAVESGSEGESVAKAIPCNPIQYTSSLLHDFNMKTQLLGTTTCTDIDRLSSNSNATEKISKDDKAESIASPRPASAASTTTSTTTTAIMRKRGRPRKNPSTTVDMTASKTSESPDSGIISTPHSPVQPTSVQHDGNSKGKSTKSRTIVAGSGNDNGTIKSKLNANNLEKSIYATERVLYPPRRKRNDVNPATTTARTEEILDPAWREIDINKKFRRPSISGYKSDGGNTVCSRILAAKCDYLSDYGNVNERNYSGYKSDYSCKSRRSGYRSDYTIHNYSSKARSCGYRSDCSVKHRRKVRRKRRVKTSAAKPSVNEQDLLMLAGLSLGQSEPSEESSRDSVLKPETITVDTAARKRPMFRRKTFSGVLASSSRRTLSGTSRELLSNLCERVTKRISGLDTSKSAKPALNESVNMSTFAGLYKDKGGVGPLKLNSERPGMIRSRRSSAVSHCSSHYSTVSRHPFHKRRRKRLKSISRSDNSPAVNISKINLQIEQLIASFPALCAIVAEKSNKENAGHGKTSGTKRAVKKRKGSDNLDAAASTVTTTTKRRHKKTAQTEHPDDQKLPSSLPLKKRHYLLTPGEKANEKGAESKGAQSTSATADKADKQKTDDGSGKSLPKSTANKAVTPKKRHLLETSPANAASSSSTADASASNEKASAESGRGISDGANGKISTQTRKNEALTRKKNRLEGLVSKIQQPVIAGRGQADKHGRSDANTRGSTPRISVIRNSFSETGPPPGVFEPSMDLELQIPYVAISLPFMNNRFESDSPRSVGTTKTSNSETKPRGQKVVEKLLKSTNAQALLKRKRKKPNRTGFPTLKKKKKRVATPVADTSACSSPMPDTASNTFSPDALIALKTVSSPEVRVTDILQNCDRVPNDGEPTASFIERNSRPRLSVISLEKLQGKVETAKTPTNDISKRLRDTSSEQRNRKKPRQELLKESGKPSRDSSLDSEPLIQRKNAYRRKATPAELSDEDEPLLNRLVAHKNKLRAEQKTNDSKSGKETRTGKVEVSKGAFVKLEISEKVNLMAIRQRKNHSKKLKQIEPVPASTDLSVNQSSLKRKRGRPSRIAMKEKVDVVPNIEDGEEDVVASITKEATDTESKSNKKPKLDKSTTATAKITSSKQKKDAEVVSLGDADGKRSTGAKAKTDIAVIGVEEKPNNLRAMSKTSSEIVDKPSSDATKAKAKDTSSKSGRNMDKPASNSEKVTEKSKHLLPTTKVNKKQNHTEKSSKNEKIKPTEKSIVDDVKHTATKKSEKPSKSTKTVDKDIATAANSSSKGKDAEAESSTPKTVKKLDKKNAQIEVAKESDINVPLDEDYAYDETDVKPFNDEEVDRIEDDPLPPRESDIQADVAEVTETQDSRKPFVKSRKKYLSAGLFSQYYKEHHPVGDKTSRLANNEEPPTTLLPAPLYCEKYFRQTVNDFQLPYDLWWAHENQKLPGRNIIQSWNFKKIRTNVYGDVRANPSSDHQPCSCKQETACGDDCLNRMVYTECNPETCPCGDKCQNTKIQRHIIAPGVERFMTTNKGWGVQAKLPINKGTYILEYVGEVVTEREFKDRMATLYNRDIHHYCLHLDGGLVIDGHRMGSDCRFVNHSCSPNCEMQKWSVNGLSRMALFASRNIQPGEELTYDYNFSLFNPAEGQPCKCESAECRGVIGGKSQRVRPIEAQVSGDMAKSGKRDGRRPKKGGTSKGRTFMHSKDATKMNVFQLPGPKEQGLILDGHCFLLRNLKKVSLAESWLFIRYSISNQLSRFSIRVGSSYETGQTKCNATSSTNASDSDSTNLGLARP